MAYVLVRLQKDLPPQPRVCVVGRFLKSSLPFTLKEIPIIGEHDVQSGADGNPPDDSGARGRTGRGARGSGV